MCNCGGARGTTSNGTSAQLGQTTQRVDVPQPTAEQRAATVESTRNALANANS